ncbi:YcdB/YcdC domain-containing protein [Bacillus sp. Marseille-Q3570]|uniref:YcdB/YcdC domain-containing protein n=1 Tax=Bacillus sp. Marseille-Q3570 TaxID=2963522 RepID=UPI0021B6FBAF|nr:YcdB/YcdC domain-containing protein [Bacillus sp. Marseille-Q3570]
MDNKIVRVLVGVLCLIFMWNQFDYVQAGNSSQSVGTYTHTNLNFTVEDVDISREKAIEIVKQTFPIPADFVQESIRLHKGWSGTEKLWRISWITQVPKLQTIEVGVNALDGSIMEVRIYIEPNNKWFSNRPGITVKDAVDIAEKYIENHYPDIGTLILKTKDLSHPGRFDLQFIQMVKGVPFPENEMTFQIGKNGEIESHHFRMRNRLHFKPLTDILPYNVVKEKIKKEADLELSYLDLPQAQDTFLAYLPKNNNDTQLIPLFLIDANSGEWVDHSGQPLKKNMFLDEPVFSEFQPKKKPDMLLNQRQAYQLVKNQFSISENVVITYRHYDEEKAVWEFHLGYVEGPKKVMHAVVDAINGEVIRFSRKKFNVEDDIKINLTKEEAMEKAIDFVELKLPVKAAGLYPRVTNESFADEGTQARAYDIHFVRKHNGIRVANQGVDIQVSALNGEITEYTLAWKDIDFPSVGKIISTTKAKELHNKERSVELIYMVPVPDHPSERKKLIGKKKEAIPVYKVKSHDGVFLDARIGKWRDRITGEIIQKRITDLDGHWAEKEINKLVHNGFIEVEQNRFHPDEAITGLELTNLLEQAIEAGGGNRKLPYGLNQFKKEVSREDFALRLVQVLDLDQFSEEEKVVVSNFLDEDKIIHKKEVGLIQKMGIMQGSHNKFRPKDSLTKAEAAVVISRLFKENKFS